MTLSRHFDTLPITCVAESLITASGKGPEGARVGATTWILINQI